MTTLLVDTHALLWWLTDDRRLPRRSRSRITGSNALVLVSAATAWEVSIKRSLGKLTAPNGLVEVVEESGLLWIPITPAEAYDAGNLPMHHRDPFDRLIIAQAQIRSAVVVSHDEMLDDYGIERVWR